MQKTITIKTLKIAQAGAAKMTRQGYTYQASPTTPGTFCVVKPDGGNHLVDLVAGYCSCPFHEENAYCKHRRWMEDNTEADQMEEEQAAREFAEADRYAKF